MCAGASTCVCPFNKRSSRRTTGKKWEESRDERGRGLLPKTFQFPSVAEGNLLRQLPLPLFFSWVEMGFYLSLLLPASHSLFSTPRESEKLERLFFEVVTKQVERCRS